MSDTTTQLQHTDSPGGDLMDEELVTQSDGITQAKRPRVVISGITGTSIVNPVNVDPGANPYSMPTLSMALVDDAPRNNKDGELRPISITPEGRVRVSMVAASVDPDFVGDEPGYFGCVTYASKVDWY